MKRLIPIAALLAFLWANAAYSQALLPFVEGQFFDNNGNPLASGKICTYVTGTSTNLATYPTFTDAVNSTNANANPVVLDSAGRANIWLKAGSTYRIIIYANGTGNTCNGTAVGTAIKTVDGVAASPFQFSGDLLPSVTNTYNIGSQTYQWKDEFLSEMLQIAGSSFATVAPTSSGRIVFNSTLGYFQCSQSASTYRRCNDWNEDSSSILSTDFGTARIGKGSALTSGTLQLWAGNSAYGTLQALNTGYVTLTGGGFFYMSIGPTSAVIGDNNGQWFSQTNTGLTLDTGIASNFIQLNGAGNPQATFSSTATIVSIQKTTGSRLEVQASAVVAKDSSSNTMGLWNTTSSASATNLWLLNNGTLSNVKIESTSTSCQSASKKCLYVD